MTTRITLPSRPRVLVVGAGVLGTLYAARLALADHDITVLELAPDRVAQIRDNGLVIEKIGGARETASVDVLTEVDADTDFDIALVIVRKIHLQSALDALAPTRIPTIVAMTSNADGPTAITATIGDRAVLGFPGAGGSRVGDLVRYSIPPRFMQPTMLGEIDGSRSARVASISALIASAGFNPAVTADMDAWLKSHEAFVAATANATYAAGGDGRALAHNPTLVRLAVLAMRELYTAIPALGHRVNPGYFRLWRLLPLRLSTELFSRFLGSAAWELGTDQINSMRNEVEVITEELLQLSDAAMVPAPALRELVRRREAVSG